MFSDWMTAIEASRLAEALRSSVWAYPLVNAGHILSVALLVGGTVPLGLRLLGLWRATPLDPLRRVLARSADAGLLLAVLFGLLLFIARASAYVQSPVFVAKMLVLAGGIADTLILRIIASRWAARGGAAGGRTPASLRAAAGVSLAIWPAVLILGRLIGYF